MKQNITDRILHYLCNLPDCLNCGVTQCRYGAVDLLDMCVYVVGAGLSNIMYFT